MKAGSTSCSARPTRSCEPIFAGHAGRATIWRRDDDFGCTANRLAVGGRLLDLRTPGGQLRRRLPALHGAHQGDNAAVALAAAEAFFDRPLDADLVREAFAAVRNPGRFEVVRPRPARGPRRRPQPRRRRAPLADALDEGFAVLGEPAPRASACSTGRDPRELLETLGAADAVEVICCTPDSPARPARRRPRRRASRGSGARARVVPDVGAALRRGARRGRRRRRSCSSPAASTRSARPGRPLARPAIPGLRPSCGRFRRRPERRHVASAP